MRCIVMHPDLEGEKTVVPLASMHELVKAHPEGLFRYGFLVPDGPESADELLHPECIEALPLLGPLTITHSVLRAGDLLLESCEYEGLRIELEVQGKCLPELPPQKELQELLNEPSALVHVDGRPFKVNAEVFGFQRVYDDVVRALNVLKHIGVPQETMAVFATPSDISIEIHPDIFGLPPEASRRPAYQHLLLEVGGLRCGDYGLVKTTNRTILTNTVGLNSWILVPGCQHPQMHRPKVGVGPSHFAYGVAAFSDYCGKKRDLDECLKETKTWVKFLRTNIPPIAALKTKAEEYAARPPIGFDDSDSQGDATASPQSFRPLKLEIRDLKAPPGIVPGHSTTYPELDRTLGGGWCHRGLHLLIGGREEGKAAFLIGQAMALAVSSGVLYLSSELDRHEFLLRAAAWLHKISVGDILQRKTQNDQAGKTAVANLQKLVDSLTAQLGENLFFRGTDSAVDILAVEQISQLIDMVPPGAGRILFLESLSPDDLLQQQKLAALRRMAEEHDVTIIASVHGSSSPQQRPHFIEGDDITCLERFQRYADSVTTLQTERINMRKFLAMSQGKTDPEMLAKLEAHLLHAAGGQKMRGDTYSLMRTIHARNGLRRVELFLYQRDTGRFFEGPGMPLSRP